MAGNIIFVGIISKSTPCVAVVFPPIVKLTVAISVGGREICKSTGTSIKSQFTPSLTDPPLVFIKLIFGWGRPHFSDNGNNALLGQLSITVRILSFWSSVNMSIQASLV